MRGWLADFFRSLGAPWWWNTRKLVFVVRGRRGQCPCHNASDSGAPGETRCEAVTYWHSPRRFARRVCPLLQENAAGEWRCSARPEQVRPFWGRLFALYALLLGLVVGSVGGGLWLTMRTVGYEVTPRQIFWPGAWGELEGVRARFFRRQAEELVMAGKYREALASLTLAATMAPRDYDTAMMLAQVDHVARPERVDFIYRRLYEEHPARRDDTSRAWFRSLLARGQLASVADLASRRLVDSPAEWRVWLHGLLFAARAEKKWEPVEAVAANERVPVEARAVLAFELRLRQAEWSEAKTLLVREPLPSEPYALMHRIERLLEWGDAMEALFILREKGRLLAQTDAFRLLLAAHAVGRNHVAREADVRGLLAREGQEGEYGLLLVAQHLVRYPSDALLEQARAAARRLASSGGEAYAEALAALYCAAALGGKADWLSEIRELTAPRHRAGLVTEQRLDEALARGRISPVVLLGVVRPLSLELNYSVLERAVAGN
ncbi:MAG: hypothetical protein C0518_01580 [Opitutus sp.]|nr:hypothetical protein [Opitutus sp.]